ncbi:MAG: NAD(P)/FAD-dependent oxidoreductase [Chitinophagaceae bacterium]
MKHLVIVGGGAAGFFCAAEAHARCADLRITLLEKQKQVLQKVKVSGGGRCNVTNAVERVSELVQHYPRGASFLKKAFTAFNTVHTKAWFEAHGVPLKTEADGRVFPKSNSSQSVIDCLLKACEGKQVHIQLSSELVKLQRVKEQWQLTLKNGNIIKADYVQLACGGFPKLEQYAWLSDLGFPIVPPVPSLFTFNIAHKPLTELAGLSVPMAQVSVVGSAIKQSGPLLITHWGLSGPAVLKTSAFGARYLAEKNYHSDVMINWLNEPEHRLQETWQGIRNGMGSQTMGQKNPLGLPARLWLYLLERSGINESTKWSELGSKAQHKLVHTLCADTYTLQGKTTFKEEFVTCGGIDLSAIDPKTYQSKLHPHLYLGGELLDVDGVTGGFNFQHAWTSGYLAAQAITNDVLLNH